MGWEWVGTWGLYGDRAQLCWGTLGALVPDHPQCQPIVCLSVCSQNWAGMRCPYKLLRMVLALVCSE